MKLIILILLFVIIKIVNSVPIEPNFSYCNALKSSLNFFNGNRAGNLTSSDLPMLYPWQSGVTTNFDSTIDKSLDSNGNGILSGGFFNDGSYIKSTFALAHSITTLAWTFLEFQYNIDSCSGLKKQYLSTLRIGLDWLMAAHPSQNTIYAQCGKVGDLSKWNIPSRIYDLYNGSPKRSCWLIINENNPGSDVAHEMASAFAASHMIFSLIDPTYAIQLRTHAFQLFDFGFSYPGKYSDIETSGEPILYPSSDYKDELLWASAWMYQITGKSKYLSIINSQQSNGLVPNFTSTASSVIYNYDQKYSAAVLFLSKNFGLFGTQSNNVLNYWSTKMPKTNDGLFFIDSNGSIRYSMGGSLLVAIWNNNQHSSKQFADTFNIDQINIVLGNNSHGQSYICGVGYLGASTPVNLHHRASHYSIANSITNPTSNSFPLEGALVGGPINKFDFYIDDRTNYTMNQPTIEYNALLTGVLASMIINETIPEQPDTPTTGPYTTTGTPPPSYTTTSSTGYGTTGYSTTSKPTGYGTTGGTSYGTTGGTSYGTIGSTGYGTTGSTGYGTTNYGTTTMSSSNVGTTTTATTSSSSTSSNPTSNVGSTTSTSSITTSSGITANPSTISTSTSTTSSITTSSGGSTTNPSTTSTSTTTTSSITTSGISTTTSSSSTSGGTTSSSTTTSPNQGSSDSIINPDSQSFDDGDSSSSSSSSSSKIDNNSSNSNSDSNSHENNGSYSNPDQSSSSVEEPTIIPTNTPNPTSTPTQTPTQTPSTPTPTQTQSTPTEIPTKSPINSTETSSESFNTANRITQRNSLWSSIFVILVVLLFVL
ncbi:hypothetical protein ACTFIU_006133 [Dictyostelium citrinum]